MADVSGGEGLGSRVLGGKVVVVAGVGDGLGSEVVRLALRDGAKVALAARSADKLEAIAKDLDPGGERTLVCKADMTDEAACEALMAKTRERFGAIHAVAIVAAFDTVFGTLQSTDADTWRKSLDVNVIGTTRLARAAVPHLRESGGGSVVLVGSQAMWLAPPNAQIAYAAAKGALLSAMYHMAEELGPDRIRVNMVIPTWMWGPPVQMYVRWQSKERGISEQAVIDEITANMPLGEIPADEDVAEAIVFFCSDRSRMITGETLLVNAGEIMR